MRSTLEEVAIATVRDYWDRRPCNLRHSPAPVGTRDYFEQVEQRKYFVEPHIPAFSELPTLGPAGASLKSGAASAPTR